VPDEASAGALLPDSVTVVASVDVAEMVAVTVTVLLPLSPSVTLVGDLERVTVLDVSVVAFARFDAVPDPP
jgi:hypothetical protein